MIWIATLCLLAIAAWLFFNALNERRWVEAHSHDESVAADRGFLPDYQRLVSRMTGHESGSRVSIGEENSAFARAVGKVREKTERVGERIERRAAEARAKGDEESFFGRAVARVGEASRRADEKLQDRMRRAREASGRRATEEETLFGRATGYVARKQEEYGARVRERVAERAATDQPPKPITEEGFFGRMVDKVSKKLERQGQKLDEKAAASRAKAEGGGGLDADDDLLSRWSAKLGRRVNEIDDRIVERSREAERAIERRSGV